MSNVDKYHAVVHLLQDNGMDEDDAFVVTDVIWDTLELKHPYEDETTTTNAEAGA